MFHLKSIGWLISRGSLKARSPILCQFVSYLLVVTGPPRSMVNVPFWKNHDSPQLPACPPAYRAPAGLPWNSRSDLQHTHSLLNPAWTLTRILSTKLLTSFLQVGKHLPYLYSPIVLCIIILILTLLQRSRSAPLSTLCIYIYISFTLFK